jgi:hypothetical protein
MTPAHVWAPRGARGFLLCGPDACPEGIVGPIEAFGRRPFRHGEHHRRVRPSGGWLIAEEWFQRIVDLAFTPALLERQQDPPCFRKDLLGGFIAAYPSVSKLLNYLRV